MEDCVSVIGTGLYLGPDLYPVVYRFKLFQIEMIIREYSFIPTGWVWLPKKFVLQALAPSWRLPLLPVGQGGGGVVEKICIKFAFSRVVLSSLYWCQRSEFQNN